MTIDVPAFTAWLRSLFRRKPKYDYSIEDEAMRLCPHTVIINVPEAGDPELVLCGDCGAVIDPDWIYPTSSSNTSHKIIVRPEGLFG